MADEADAGETKKKRGPRRGIKHSPGRGHRRKSQPQTKKRFRKKAKKKRRQNDEAARRLWKEWDDLTPEQQRLLGPKGAPKLPRPKYED